MHTQVAFPCGCTASFLAMRCEDPKKRACMKVQFLVSCVFLFVWACVVWTRSSWKSDERLLRNDHSSVRRMRISVATMPAIAETPDPVFVIVLWFSSGFSSICSIRQIIFFSLTQRSPRDQISFQFHGLRDQLGTPPQA